MKTSIIAIVASVLFSIGNVFASTGSNIYKNVTIDKQSGTQETITYKGENEKHLTPLKRYFDTNDQSGNTIERVISKWNETSNKWENEAKYIYLYNPDNQVMAIAYTKWEKSSEQWENNAVYTVYERNSEDNSLSINYVKIDSSIPTNSFVTQR